MSNEINSSMRRVKRLSPLELVGIEQEVVDKEIHKTETSCQQKLEVSNASQENVSSREQNNYKSDFAKTEESGYYYYLVWDPEQKESVPKLVPESKIDKSIIKRGHFYWIFDFEIGRHVQTWIPEHSEGEKVVWDSEQEKYVIKNVTKLHE